MSYMYFSTQRPLAPGAFPRPAGNRVEALHNYDSRTYSPEVDREVWGYIVYEQPLVPQDVLAYELTPVDRQNCAGCINEAAARDEDCCWDCNRNPRRKRMDLYRHKDNA